MGKKRSIFGMTILLIGVFAIVYIGFETHGFRTYSSEVGIDISMFVIIITVLILLYAGFTAESSLSERFLGINKKPRVYEEWKEERVGITKAMQIKNLCPKCGQEVDPNIAKCPNCGCRFKENRYKFKHSSKKKSRGE